MLAYLRAFVTRYLLIMLKRSASPKRLELAYTALTCCESLVKCAYRLINASDSFFLCSESTRTQKSQTIDSVKMAPAVNPSSEAQHDSQAIETDSIEKEQRERDQLLVRQSRMETIQFGDLIFENVKHI